MLGINVMKSLINEDVIVSMALYGTEAWELWNESECSCNEVFEKFVGNITNV